MKKISILILFLAFTFHSFAQNETSNLDKKLKFGINLGLNYSNLVFDETDFPEIIEVEEGFGFQLGILADYQFLKYFSISPRANLTFNNATFEIDNPQGTNPLKHQMLPVGLELLTYLTIKKEIGEATPYVFVGLNYKRSLDYRYTTSYFGRNNDLAIDFGIGLNKCFKYFNFAPELKYSYGLRDLIENPIRVKSFNFHQFSLVFNFLG